MTARKFLRSSYFAPHGQVLRREMMRAELFADIAEAIEDAVDTNRSCTEYIKGKLTELEVASLEDTSRYRVELSVCEQMFRIWIVAHLHDIGFTGLF